MFGSKCDECDEDSCDVCLKNNKLVSLMTKVTDKNLIKETQKEYQK